MNRAITSDRDERSRSASLQRSHFVPTSVPESQSVHPHHRRHDHHLAHQLLGHHHHRRLSNRDTCQRQTSVFSTDLFHLGHHRHLDRYPEMSINAFEFNVSLPAATTATESRTHVVHCTVKSTFIENTLPAHNFVPTKSTTATTASVSSTTSSKAHLTTGRRYSIHTHNRTHTTTVVTHNVIVTLPITTLT
jgi:hypothetical protein